ncbi:uncharacterized protein LOC107054261 [Gallus gallus]|uniref:uncharacterized protein LOC107054261 n=1 Tax=Gallus gallus TaxID=9031 RepID=UPI001F02E675|nr:uncharacterized protein LOC107054261 [Gallus gallus]
MGDSPPGSGPHPPPCGYVTGGPALPSHPPPSCRGTAGLKAALSVRSPGIGVPRCVPLPPPNRRRRCWAPHGARCRSVAVPQPRALAQDAKTRLHESQQPDLQQPDLQQPESQQPAAEGDAGPAAALQRSSKKRKSASNAQPRKKVPPRDALGRLPRLRPLYQYINLTTELMCPAEGEGSAAAAHSR